MSSKPSITFFGTPESALPILQALHEGEYSISLVVTAPDRPVGRKQVVTSPPAKTWAEKHNIPVFQPERLDARALGYIKEHGGDLSIVVAYGKILPEALIESPQYGTLNVHYSLLPAYRGASPVEATLLHGDTSTGVTIQKMARELDAGPIIAQEETTVSLEEKKPELLARLNDIAAELLLVVLPRWIRGEITPIPQDDTQATYCYTVKKEEGEVQLTDSDEVLWNTYRAFYGWPGIFFFTDNGKRVKITQAHLEDGSFVIDSVIPEGKGETPYEVFKQSRI